MKKILIFLSSIMFINTFAYEEKMYNDIEKSNESKIVIDVVSHDPNNPDRHFNFINKVSNDFPNKKFRLAVHGDATFYALKNEKFEDQKDKLYKNKSEYKINFEKNNFNILKNLENVEFFLCKSGAKKRLVDLNDVHEIFNTDYTSSQINFESQKNNFIILKEKEYIKNEIETLKKSIKTFQSEPSELDIPIPQNIKHSFDIKDFKQYNTVLRFLDMHLEAGMKAENINVAIVVRGKAVDTLLKQNKNNNLELILNSKMVDVFVCGQNLSKKKYNKNMLKDGVKISLSAMTAHNYLQKNGYTLNPF